MAGAPNLLGVTGFQGKLCLPNLTKFRPILAHPYYLPK
jgi:hypothetical protein